MGESSTMEVQDIKQFQDGRKFQDRSSRCEAVPGLKFQNGKRFQNGISGCETVPG
jgi:hypothetical protein